MNQLPAITKATVKVAVTFEDGTTCDYDFELDVAPNEDCPIAFNVSVDNDIRDVTDVEVDSFRQMALGDRRRIALSIGGRGPMPALKSAK